MANHYFIPYAIIKILIAKHYKIQERVRIVGILAITLGMFVSASIYSFATLAKDRVLEILLYLILGFGIDLLLSYILLRNYSKKITVKFSFISNLVLLITTYIIFH